MTNSKNTKRALLASVLAMLVCVAMLIGSTFAWFTDSVTSGANKIIAGNLSIELEHATEFDDAGNPTQWETVAGATDLFKSKDETLWEPGHAEVVYLRLRNAGSLALKYKFEMNILKEQKALSYNSPLTSKEYFYLSDYLQFGIAEQSTKFATRSDAIGAVEGTAAPIKAGYSEIGHLAKDSEYQYMALVVYMPSTVGNEANTKSGWTPPYIDLGITLVATQDTLENDSFGNTYDEDAPIDITFTTGSTDTRNALNAGKRVVLDSDISSTTSNAVYVYQKKEATLTLNGHSIAVTRTGNDNVEAIHAKYAGTVLTVEGSGLINGGSGATTNCAVMASEGGKVIIKGGSYTVGADINGQGNSCVLANGGTVEIYGGHFETTAKYGDKYWVLNCQDDNADSKIVVYGGTFVNCDPSKTGTEPAGRSDNFVADGYKVVSETKDNGDVWYTVVPA